MIDDAEIEKEKLLDLVDSILFFKGENLLFEIDRKNDIFLCSHENIWLIFENEYNMEFSNVSSFVKHSFEKFFKVNYPRP